MKFVLLIYLFLFNASNSNFLSNENNLRESSEIKITHFAHEGVTFILTEICNEMKSMKKVEYNIKCDKNIVKIEEIFTTNNNEIIKKNIDAGLPEYLKLWKDLHEIGIMELRIPPQEIINDPLKYYDSLQLDQDSYLMYFRISEDTVSNEIYDIESLKDKRFLSALEKVNLFINKNTHNY